MISRVVIVGAAGDALGVTLLAPPTGPRHFGAVAEGGGDSGPLAASPPPRPPSLGPKGRDRLPPSGPVMQAPRGSQFVVEPHTGLQRASLLCALLLALGGVLISPPVGVPASAGAAAPVLIIWSRASPGRPTRRCRQAARRITGQLYPDFPIGMPLRHERKVASAIEAP